MLDIILLVSVLVLGVIVALQQVLLWEHKKDITRANNSIIELAQSMSYMIKSVETINHANDALGSAVKAMIDDYKKFRADMAEYTDTITEIVNNLARERDMFRSETKDKGDKLN